MRYSLFAILLLSISIETAFSSEVKILNVYRELIPKDTFVRISEYFTGKENPGYRVIVRTQPQEYGGYYFILQLNKKINDLPSNTRVRLEIALAGKAESTSYTFPIPYNKKAEKEIFVGITGQDWVYEPTDLIAWKITLIDAEEKILIEKPSFLW